MTARTTAVDAAFAEDRGSVRSLSAICTVCTHFKCGGTLRGQIVSGERSVGHHEGVLLANYTARAGRRQVAATCRAAEQPGTLLFLPTL